ncbi:MAG: hypothetical protein DMF91_05575, partial [Acidobacteria bacterium]
MNRDQLAEHLRFAAELGVEGISRDPAWRRTGDGRTGDGSPLTSQNLQTTPETLVQILPAGTRNLQTTPDTLPMVREE